MYYLGILRAALSPSHDRGPDAAARGRAAGRGGARARGAARGGRGRGRPSQCEKRERPFCHEETCVRRLFRTPPENRAPHESQKRLRSSTTRDRSQPRRRRAAFLWLAPAPQRAGAARADRHVGQLLCHLELPVDSSEPRVCTETRAGTQWARSVYAACPMRSRVCTQASTRWGGVGVPRVVRVEWGGGRVGTRALGGRSGACERPYVGREEGKVLCTPSQPRDGLPRSTTHPVSGAPRSTSRAARRRAGHRT